MDFFSFPLLFRDIVGSSSFLITFTSSHKLILFLSYFVCCGYTDDVDRNYIVYTEKKVEARSFLNTI